MMMKRIAILAATAIAAIAAIASDTQQGRLTKEIVWQLEDSVLTISGRGKMPSWTTTSLINNPFQNERLAIRVKEIIIGEGITEIGSFTFGSRGNVRGERVRREGSKDAFQPLQSDATVDGSSLYSNLKYIQLPSTLRSIGGFAFARVPVKAIAIPEGVKKIGSSAFANSWLRFVRLPSTLTSVGAEAFSSCPALQAVDLNNICLELSPGMFFNCENLHMILHTANIKGIKHGALDATPFERFTDRALLSMFHDDGLESFLNTHLPSRPTFPGTDQEYEDRRQRTLKSFYKTEARNASIIFRLDEKYIMPYDATSGTCQVATLAHGTFTISLTADQAAALRADWPAISARIQPRFEPRDGALRLLSATLTIPSLPDTPTLTLLPD